MVRVLIVTCKRDRLIAAAKETDRGKMEGVQSTGNGSRALANTGGASSRNATHEAHVLTQPVLKDL